MRMSPSPAHRRGRPGRAASGLRRAASCAGITLIELVIVVMLVGAIFAVVGLSTGTFTYWKQESFLRRLTETIAFLHYQAVSDQLFYCIQFFYPPDQPHYYKVGILQVEQDSAESLAREMTSARNPIADVEQDLQPPPAFPSMGEPTEFPPGTYVADIRTMRGKEVPQQQQMSYILFSPRGFTDFAVIHLYTAGDQPVTVLVNPFTGDTEIYREYRDFEWTYGQSK